MLRTEEYRELTETFVSKKEAITDVCIKFNIAAHNLYCTTVISSVKLVGWDIRRT